MKRFYFLAASMVLLAACSGLEQPEQELFINDGENLVERIVFDVLPPSRMVVPSVLLGR